MSLFPHKTPIFVIWSHFGTRLCLIYISPWSSFFFSFVFFVAPTKCPPGNRCVMRSCFLNHTSFVRKRTLVDLHLSNTEIAVFVRESGFFQLYVDSMTYYPWNLMTLWKGCFCEGIWLFFEKKMAVLWGNSEDVYFGDLEPTFGDFRNTAVLWGCFEDCFEGCCKGVWVFECG